jgi:cyclic pyranopterin monophosphate synthase
MTHQPQSGARATGQFTHLDEHGHAHMVDVTAKPPTLRIATARCVVVTTSEAIASLDGSPGGIDPIEAARVAGLQGAKATGSLIPLCHPLRLDAISLDIRLNENHLEIVAICQIVERTGVEMEALTACALAALSLVGSLLERDPTAVVEELTLWHKSGGRSGPWQKMTHEDRAGT